MYTIYKYSCINHNNFLYSKCNFCTPKKKTKPNQTLTLYKWKASKTLTIKQFVVVVFCKKRKKKENETW